MAKPLQNPQRLKRGKKPELKVRSARRLGLYSYQKVNEDAADLPCVAVIYAIKVKSMAKTYPEAGQRLRKWVSRKQAAKLVDEPELARILKDFDPRLVS